MSVSSEIPTELPVFSTIQPEQVPAQVNEYVAELLALADAVSELPSPTWDTLARPFEWAEHRLNAFWSTVSHLNAVCHNEAWRAAYNESLPALSSLSTTLGQHEGLFQAWTRLQATQGDTLTQPQQAAVTQVLRDFRLSGIGLPEAQKQAFGRIRDALSQKTAQFADQVLDATQAWHHTLPDEARLQGLPPHALALLKSYAEQHGETGYRITLDMPSYLAVMTYAEDRSLREQVYTAYVTRASDQGPMAGQFDNGPLILDILRLRQEQADVLGYPHYAAVSLATKMANSVEEVLNFLADLAERARPGAEADLAALRALAESEEGISPLMPWDVPFYSERLKQSRYALSQEDLKPYFPAPQVLSGLFQLIHRLLGVELVPAPEVATWHPDVQVFALQEQGQVRAHVYLDLYARPGKRGGAWMADARARVQRPDDSWQRPAAYLTCNFNPPLMGQPALLTHDEVTTLFHEFGHGLHHMLTDVPVASVAGINGVAWDAVELPSQFMENWCWTSEGLALISAHVETGEPLPEALLSRLLAARNFQSGLMTLRQIEFAWLDMALHAQPVPDFDTLQQVLAAVRARTSVLVPPSWNRFTHSFTHIFAGGYAAGYYSYKWAEVLSADAFSAFEEEGILNPETGRRFRASVLARGGSAPAQDLFRAFRGRDPQPDALLRHAGLSS